MKKTLVMAAAAVLTGSMAYPSLAEEYVFEMAPVVVTANRMNENLVDARADISVVTSRQIEKLHLNTVEDALRTVPGTQYLNYGGNGLNANLSGIRINGSKDIILLVDGVRVTDFNGANNSGYMYSSLLNNMDNVERIEVLRGSAGALYGSGAKGGVINIITKNPGEKKTTVDIARGTGTGEGDGNGSGPGAGVPITPPTVINKVLPVYPPSAKMKETTGITYVTILVNASGTVDSAYVAQGSGSGILDAAAVDAAYQWTFSPALDKYGVPVPCRITFPVEFRLN